MGAEPGYKAVIQAQRAIRVAQQLGGQPRVSFDLKHGAVSGVTASVELTVEQAEVVAGRLEKLRASERS